MAHSSSLSMVSVAQYSRRIKCPGLEPERAGFDFRPKDMKREARRLEMLRQGPGDEEWYRQYENLVGSDPVGGSPAGDEPIASAALRYAQEMMQLECEF